MTMERIEKKRQKDSTALSAHIDRELFGNWQEGQLDAKEEAAFLSHISACTFCAERFGDWMEEPGAATVAPPRYLKEEIQSRTRQIDIQAVQRLKETSRQMQLVLYSLKVGLAVAVSIFLLVLTTDLQDMDLVHRKGQHTQQQDSHARQEQDGGFIGSLRRGSREITGALNDLSNGFFRVDPENESNQEVTR
ncbi:MAG: hypothetical protein HFH38_04370 [Lachnospiraceae bacterium]|jgi:hypothetical protein|nr:hypothetical protein [Lachnospiraceae bacterium]